MIRANLKRLTKVALSMCIMLLITAKVFAGNMDNIKAGFKSADAKAVANYFASSVDITFQDQKSTVGSVQAELMLSNFFSKNAVNSFEINYSGSDSGNNEYAIGEYKSANGNYSVYITLNGSKQIAELKFEKK